MKATTLLFAAIIIAIGACNTPQQEASKTSSVASESIDKLMSTYAEYGQLNGSVLVAHKGEVVYKKGFGLANAEWDIPNAVDTKFRLASVTKQFTAMLVVQLAAEGKLDLHVPISTYLPNYPKKNGDRITTHHLLTHTSGTPNYTSFRNYNDFMGKPQRPIDLVQLFADSSLAFTPGEQFSYSNSGYALLGFLIEELSGMSFEQALQEKIFTPLEMTHTGIDHNDKLIAKRATGYNKIGNTLTNSRFIHMTVPYAAGAMYSTVEDMYKWDQALYTDKLLPQKYMDMLFMPHTEARGGHYGYGWEVVGRDIGNTGNTLPSVGHGGGINGFNTQITRLPGDSTLVVVLSNTNDVPINHMIRGINGILHNEPYDMPVRSVATALVDIIEKEGIEAALKAFPTIKDADEYYLRESDMNNAAYQFINENQLENAKAIAKLNVDAFPNSFNVYDSYGEVLLMLGDSADAIENYKRSIKLNPDNENGIYVLQRLGVPTDNLAVKLAPEQVQLLVGEYQEENKKLKGERVWTITIDSENGMLYGNDQGYRYRIVPVGENSFVNPDDGATLEFNTTDKNEISFLIFGSVTFKKVK